MPLTITHAKSNIIADWTGTVTVGNSSGGTNTVQATDLVRPQDWNSAHQVTIQLTGSEIASLFNFGTGLTSTTGAGGITVGEGLATFAEAATLLNTNSTMVALPAGTWYVEPFDARHGMARGRINILRTYNSANFSHGVVGSAASTGQATKTASFIDAIAIYSQGTGANSTRIESYWSGYNALSATQSITYSSTSTNDVRVTNAITYGFIQNIDSTGGSTSTTVTRSGSLAVAASTMASTDPNSLITGGGVQDWFTGSVLVPIPFNTTLPPGAYWIGHMHTITSGGGTTGGGNYLAGTAFNSSPGHMQLLDPVLTAFKRMGSTSVANSTSLAVPFKGHLATTTSAASSNMATADMRATTGRLYWNYIQDSI
jgi:hypothetical protein